jgi:phage shock protein PspC (stress-responsive transcriptional regulator)
MTQTNTPGPVDGDPVDPTPDSSAPNDGATAGTPAEPLIVRPREGRMIAGVCAGIAQRWNIDLTLVRIGAVALTLVSGVGLAVYLAAWLLTPSTDKPAPLRPGGRGSRFLSRVPALVLIVLAAIAISALAHTLWWGAPVGLLIVALLIALVVGTRRGRWLLATVVALLVVAVTTVGVWGAEFGERNYNVTSLADLRANYDYGAGEINLDLSNLAVSGRHRTEVALGRGNVDVTVPNDVAVWVHGHAGIGSVTIDGHKVSGFDSEQSQLLGSGTESDVDRLTVDVKVGAGRINIHTA